MGAVPCLMIEIRGCGMWGAVPCLMIDYTIMQVGSINFSSYYTDYQNPLKIDVDNTFLMFSATTPYDILTRDGKVEVELPLVSHCSGPLSLLTLYLYRSTVCSNTALSIFQKY